MKTAFVLAAAGLVAAGGIDLTGIPSCAVSCIQAGLASVNCNDSTCACDPTVQSQMAAGGVSACLTKACSAADLATTVSTQAALCAAAASSSTGSGSASASTKTEESTETSASTGTSAASETTEEATKSTAGTVGTTGAAGNSTITSTRASPTPTQSASTTTTAAAGSGAAKGSVVGLLALAAAFLAAL